MLLVTELRKFQSTMPGKTPTVGDVFRSFDTDSSGDLDVAEVAKALNVLGLKADTKEAAAIFAKYDADKSGKLELPEFRQLVKDLRAFQEKKAGGGGTPQKAPVPPRSPARAQPRKTQPC